MTTTTDPTPKPETSTDDKTPKLKTTTVNQSPKPEITTSEQTPKTESTGPISPPDKPKQYRAIGLLKGKYVPSEEIERGTLVTSDGSIIDAVVLGRLLGLLKARIDLEQEHLWVVYPRTRSKAPEKSLEESGKPVDTTTESTPKTEEPEEAPTDFFKEPTPDSEPSPEEPEVPLDLSHGATVEDELAEDDDSSLEEPEELPDLSELPAEDGKPNLHVQMAGIWEPETLHPDAPAPALEQKPDYFSIRGEVVYQNKEEGWVMVKIIQFSRRKPDEKPPYFNLKLLGFLPERPVKNFWNLDVEREGTDLVIQDGQRIAYLGKRKPKKGKPLKGKPRRDGGAGQKPAQASSPKEPPKLKKKQPSSGSLA